MGDQTRWYEAPTISSLLIRRTRSRPACEDRTAGRVRGTRVGLRGDAHVGVTGEHARPRDATGWRARWSPSSSVFKSLRKTECACKERELACGWLPQPRRLATSLYVVLSAHRLEDSSASRAQPQSAEDVIPSFLKPVATEIGVFQAKSFRQAICASMTRHGGRCIDVLRAFNGVDGTDNGYAKGLLNHAACCYPSGKGQQLIAQLLLQTGLKPLR